MDLIGATNLIRTKFNGTCNSSWIYEERRIIRIIVSRDIFIFPAMVIVLLFCNNLCVKYGSIPQVGSILYGMKPVIMAIILQALYRLGKSVIKIKFL